jgi:hypothetical protein
MKTTGLSFFEQSKVQWQNRETNANKILDDEIGLKTGTVVDHGNILIPFKKEMVG